MEVKDCFVGTFRFRLQNPLRDHKVDLFSFPFLSITLILLTIDKGHTVQPVSGSLFLYSILNSHNKVDLITLSHSYIVKDMFYLKN